MTIAGFLSKNYEQVFPHTYVVAVVPFKTGEREQRCVFDYKTENANRLGPYVFCSKAPFDKFFGKSFTGFMKDIYNPAVVLPKTEMFDVPIDGKKVKVSRRKFCKEMFNLTKEPMLFREYNHHRYEFKDGKPVDVESKLRSTIKDYSSYVKELKHAKREEYHKRQRELMSKRKDMLMTDRMYQLEEEMRTILDNKWTPSSMPGYQNDPYAELRWRPRPRNPRYLRRRQYDVSDGADTMGYNYDEVDDSQRAHDEDDSDMAYLSSNNSSSRRSGSRSSSSEESVREERRRRKALDRVRQRR
jgi:hypothetical protein